MCTGRDTSVVRAHARATRTQEHLWSAALFHYLLARLPDVTRTQYMCRCPRSWLIACSSVAFLAALKHSQHSLFFFVGFQLFFLCCFPFRLVILARSLSVDHGGSLELAQTIRRWRLFCDTTSAPTQISQVPPALLQGCDIFSKLPLWLFFFLFCTFNSAVVRNWSAAFLCISCKTRMLLRVQLSVYIRNGFDHITTHVL